MIEFKFACPNCSQHIQCNDAYSGMQIICPTCKNQIVVPQAPGAIPGRPAMASSPPPVQPPTAVSQKPLPPVLNPKGKSRTKLIVVCAAVALLFVGVVAYVFITSAFSRSGVKSTGVIVAKPSGQKAVSARKPKRETPVSDQTSSVSPAPSTSPTSSDSQTTGASEIVQKVIEQYNSLTSYSASGKSLSIIDMSGVDPSKIPGISGDKLADGRNSEEFKKAISKPQRLESDFTVKLGRPDFYRVEWEGLMGPTKSKGAAWSAGDGDFLLMDMEQIKYAKMKSRELALAAATGLSAGVANTMPQIFFKGSSSLLNMFKSSTRGDDETIEGDDCYVLTGSAMGLKVILWVNKSNYLIKQKRQVLGGQMEIPDMSEEKLQEGLKQLGGNASEKQKAQMKDAMKNVRALTSQMKGSMTETYQNIEINKPLTQKDFDFEVPVGTKLSSSLF